MFASKTSGEIPLPNSTVPDPEPPEHSLNIFKSFIKAANSTSYRAPMTDYWDSKTASYGGKYRARPVVGGIWAPVVVQLFDKLPVFPHEAPMAAAFERGHAKAKLNIEAPMAAAFERGHVQAKR